MRLLYMTAAAIGAAVVTAAMLAARQQGPSGDVPLLQTPAWVSGTPEYGDQLLIRRDGRSGDLLLKHSKRETAYRYDAHRRTLTATTPDEWRRAAGPVAECDAQLLPPQDVLKIDQQSHQLTAGPRHIPTAGRNALSVAMAPGGRLVAVLSASGEMARSVLPALGSGGATGEHYHQIVALPDGAVVGNPVRLPVRRDADVLSACWSADAKTVVYRDVVFSYLSVVDIGL